MDDDIDEKIEDFLNSLNKEEFESVLSGKEISANFSALNSVLEPLNETKIIFENPELKINKQIRNKILATIPVKASHSEDDNFLKDLKLFQTIYELDAKKINELVINVKDNFYMLSGSVKSLINAVEKSKSEYFETINLMMTPMTTQVEKLDKIEVNKFNKEKKLNYEEKREKLDDEIREYDAKLSKIITEKKGILVNVNENLTNYINLLNKLDGPINLMIEDIDNIFNIFEDKSKQFINILMNYINTEEKKEAMKIFNEIQSLNTKIVTLVNDYSLQLIQNKKNIEKDIQSCNNDLENIRQNNMASSEELTQLQEETKNIIRNINDLLKFCWIKTKVPQITKNLKGFQLYDIKSKMEEGTKNVIKANEKLEIDLNQLKVFVKEKNDLLNQIFSLDLVFIMDITGSMDKFLKFTKEKIIEIINKITEDSTVKVRLGFIGYRDDLDNKSYEYFKFPELSSDVAYFKNSLESVKVGGGGDCEDMAGGMTKALEYDWNSKSKFALLIADAPCHGIQYHEIANFDSHQNGDPRYKMDEIVKTFAAKNINLLCLNIDNKTRQLYENFKKYYAKGKKLDSSSIIEVADFSQTEVLAGMIVSKSKEFYEKRHES